MPAGVVDHRARGDDDSLAGSQTEHYASEHVVRSANRCVQVHGGCGYIDEHAAGKHLRDA